jgi:hypothetical protein
LCLALLAPRAQAEIISDWVFVVDQSVSMQADLASIADQVLFLPTILASEGLDPDDVRVAIVAYGTNRHGNGPVEPRLALDWVGAVDTASLSATFDALSNQPIRETESGTEGIQFALDQLAFRPEAKVNFVLFTDEDDDRPASIAGDREPPAGWTGCLFTPGCLVDVEFHQDQVDLTAQGLINTAAQLSSQQVLLNMIINPGDRPSRYQYGDPDATRLTPEGRLNLAATLQALRDDGYDDSLQGQLLRVGLLARAFPMSASRANPSAFWEDFFRVKAQEIIPEPGSLALLLTALAGTALLRRTRSR